MVGVEEAFTEMLPKAVRSDEVTSASTVLVIRLTATLAAIAPPGFTDCGLLARASAMATPPASAAMPEVSRASIRADPPVASTVSLPDTVAVIDRPMVLPEPAPLPAPELASAPPMVRALMVAVLMASITRLSPVPVARTSEASMAASTPPPISFRAIDRPSAMLVVEPLPRAIEKPPASAVTVAPLVALTVTVVAETAADSIEAETVSWMLLWEPAPAPARVTSMPEVEPPDPMARLPARVRAKIEGVALAVTLTSPSAATVAPEICAVTFDAIPL